MNDFLIFCSGVTPGFIKRSPADFNKYVGIGATILFTGLLAGLAAGYAAFTVFESYFVAIFMGGLWGLMIFNLDRYIVSSMRKMEGFWKSVVMVVPRLVFAILIAMVISKPLEMKLFEKEIEAEIISMQEIKYKDQEDLLRKRFDPKVQQLEKERDLVKEEVENRREKAVFLEKEALAEADGTGGSKQRNLGPIYKAKKLAADQALQDYEALAQVKNPEIEKLTLAINVERSKMDQALKEQEKVALTGFASRLDALGNLTNKSSTIYWASIFITLLFIALETAPIFTKLIASKSPLDYVQDKHFATYSFAHKRYLDIRKKENLYHARTSQQAVLHAVEKENEIMKESLNAEAQKLKEEGFSFMRLKKWRQDIGDLFAIK